MMRRTLRERRLVEYAENIEVGHGLENPNMDPHVSESELSGTLDYIDVGQNEGATLAYGSEALTGGEYENGYFIEPAVFTDVGRDMRIF